MYLSGISHCVSKSGLLLRKVCQNALCIVSMGARVFVQQNQVCVCARVREILEKVLINAVLLILLISAVLVVEQYEARAEGAQSSNCFQQG